MKSFFLIIMLITAGFPVFAQNADTAALSKTEKGKRILDYFAAFNSGDEARLKNFILENVAEESLKQRSVEPRMQFQRMLREAHQSFEIRRVTASSDSEIGLLAEGKTGGWVSYTFKFGSSAPYKLLGWIVQRTEEPANVEKFDDKTPTTKTELLSTLEKYINDRTADGKFSGVVMIVKDDKPIFTKAYGAANREKNIANNADTKFNLGSINKIFTRIAIGQLLKQGKVSFDDQLGKYLPDYPNQQAREKVTIRHLVTMRSGIGDFFGEKFLAMSKDKLRTNADFIPLFADQPLAFEPGTNQRYSNGGYILLGAIIEKVTGQSYYQYVRENIFKPARMTDTDSYEMDKLPANTANGYTRRNPKGELVNNVNVQPARGSAAGGGYSTLKDLLKFSVALKSGKLNVPDDDGAPRKDASLGVAGGSDGVNSILLVDSQTGYTIIVLANLDPPSAESVGERIRDWTKQIKE